MKKYLLMICAFYSCNAFSETIEIKAIPKISEILEQGVMFEFNLTSGSLPSECPSIPSFSTGFEPSFNLLNKLAYRKKSATLEISIGTVIDSTVEIETTFCRLTKVSL